MSDEPKTNDHPNKTMTDQTQPRQTRALALQIDLREPPENTLLYLKSDFMQACYVGNDLALSFYQIDYQHAANSASIAKEAVDSTTPLHVKTKLIPVARIVMGKEAAKAMAIEMSIIMNSSDPGSV